MNDRPIPDQYATWQQKGGFWGKIAGYYARKHEVQQTVYRSPFTARPYGPDLSDAHQYYQGLPEEARGKIDEYQENAMRF